ncbi:hypothetical protein ACWZHB_04250 [Nocardia sp. FBN12]|uniref:hypothetical protein n=1 Tax=Nocardia sp. FBN12 TaxID=3419766 RepID=UPI003D02A956
MSAEWLTRDGALVPTAIVLSHIEQRNRLISALPAAASNIIVAGDICFDQLSASLPLRASYRRAYGLPSHRKLVVISSTWGESSLLEKHPDLPRRIAESLPVDEFRIVLAPHPNIVAEHSSWQFGRYQAAATRAGVHVLDDVDEWKAAVLAADLVVGDHGSVPFYATAIGIAPLLATVADHTVDPGSPIAGFLAAAPALEHDGDLAQQIRTAIAAHTADRYTAITDLTTSRPDASASILRTVMYEAMGLSEPTIPAELCAVSLPTAPLSDTESHLVQVNSPRRGAADVVRYPAERLRTGTDLPRGAHLAVSVVEPSHRWLRLADIMIGLPGANTAGWIADTLLGLPGCRLATAPDESGGWLLGDGSTLLSVTGSDEVCRVFASVAQRRISGGDALADLSGEWKINCGGVEHTVHVSEVPRPDSSSGA